ncbi:hypothetical protein C8F04DRAFT_1254752 [Mycena alexandri]|uniref:Uncharacterized protein n=1 Tax=Mycena alexandri TaxID=1745969 RepID=A0AAD6X557_9AGAR|nr:hypothetical protein C8F04DRAFT_1254752 [Mycena alexandri]
MVRTGYTRNHSDKPHCLDNASPGIPETPETRSSRNRLRGQRPFRNDIPMPDVTQRDASPNSAEIDDLILDFEEQDLEPEPATPPPSSSEPPVEARIGAEHLVQIVVAVLDEGGIEFTAARDHYCRTPGAKQQELLDSHRARYFRDQTRLIRARAKARRDHKRPLPNMRDYDLCCEYYREIYMMQAASSASLYTEVSEYAGSDTESDTSNHSSMPPLGSSGPASSVVKENMLVPNSPPADTALVDATSAAVDTTSAADTTPVDATVTVDATASLQNGESYTNMDIPPFTPTLYSTDIPVFIPVAEVPENLRFSESDIPRDFIRHEGVHTDAESLKRVWSLLNEVNRPQFPQLMGPRRRSSLSEAYQPPTHRLKIFTRTGVRHIRCRCTNGRHSSFERRQAYAFPDGNGNIVVKKSKSLLLPLP